jgi:phage tail-like protein
MDDRPGQVSTLLNYLPAIFQDFGVSSVERLAAADQANFLGRFLLAFEKILLGLGAAKNPAEEASGPGLEEILGGMIDPVSGTTQLAGIYRYFEPGAALQDNERTPPAFLQWLAGWVALTLREDWDELRKRDLIAKAVQLYRLRGTKRGVEEFLRIYTRLGVEIDELNTPFQIGVHSTIGQDTLLDGGSPFFFKVHVLLPTPDPNLIKQQQATATAIVDLQKPAYTYYQLTVDTPTFQIGVHSTIGVDTLLGQTQG